MLNFVNKGPIQKARDDSIAEMKEALEHVQKTTAPRWLMSILVIPLFLWEIMKSGWRTLIAGLVALGACILAVVVLVPLMLIIFIDTVLVIRWFYSRILDKMCGE